MLFEKTVYTFMYLFITGLRVLVIILNEKNRSRLETFSYIFLQFIYPGFAKK